MRRRGAAVALALLLIVASTKAAGMDIPSLWDFGDPARSETIFREQLANTRGDDALSLQTQIARTYSLRSRFDDAHALLDRIAAQVETAGPEPKVRALLERGRTYRSSAQVDKARPLFRQAVDLAIAEKLEFLAVDAMHMVALVEPGLDGQLAWNRQALAYAQRAGDPAARRWDATLSNNIGVALHGAGRYEEALEALRTQLAARERIGKPEGVRIAHWMIAWTLRAMKRHDEALAILMRLEQEFAAEGKPDGFVFEEIAENLLAQGRPDAARPWFARAHALLSQDHTLDRPDDARLARLLALSR
jgi:tetratricopeptide (TPR) repeat protein